MVWFGMVWFGMVWNNIERHVSPPGVSLPPSLPLLFYVTPTAESKSKNNLGAPLENSESKNNFQNGEFGLDLFQYLVHPLFSTMQVLSTTGSPSSETRVIPKNVRSFHLTCQFTLVRWSRCGHHNLPRWAIKTCGAHVGLRAESGCRPVLRLKLVRRTDPRLLSSSTYSNDVRNCLGES